MSKLVIFGESYGYIKHVLYLITQNQHDRPVTVVIPGFLDLFQFFQVINERVFHNAINLIYIEAYQPRRAKVRGIIKKIPHVIPDIIKERRYLKEAFTKNFAGCEGCEVFFFSRGFSGLKFYLLKKLSNRNRVVYISCYLPQITPMRKYTPGNIVDLASLAILKSIYGRDIAVGKLPNIKGFPYMPDRFMEREVDKIIDWDETDAMMRDFDLSQFKVFDAGHYSVIYFHQDLIGGGYITDAETFRRELASVFDVVLRHFPEKELAFKDHPGDTGDKTLIRVGDILPAFIPAELLYDENVKMYLSGFSYSIANVEKGLAVSLIDLITFKSDEIRNGLKERLIKVSKSKILFPESLDEFERILIDLKKQKA